MATIKKASRFYQNGRLATELSGAETRSVFQHKNGLLAQSTSGAEATHTIMAVNSANTVITELGLAGKAQFPYTPYGRRPPQSEANNPLAFNGEPLDSATGGYLLGNGYRLFNPTLKRFCNADNLSPFDKGGLNAYGYCSGDPVNRVDPSGHFAFHTLLFAASMVTFATATALEIAANVVKSNTARKDLAIAAYVLTGVGLALTGGAIAARRFNFSPFRRQPAGLRPTQSMELQPRLSPQPSATSSLNGRLPRSRALANNNNGTNRWGFLNTEGSAYELNPPPYSAVSNGAQTAPILGAPPPTYVEAARALNLPFTHSPTSNTVRQRWLSTSVPNVRRQ